ncbi:helix-turn-helix domain-containing protein [Pseudanabaena sp. UWO310]|uniref:helix-turn-helix domain-containing protein n=1 Tax=Pseudanabaena sp. UWO310 TaxID=2480795 RepID=UPI00115C4318|nr:helix-turn-helix domain-containing protein [Pseudanabaena sp. UWO310]TYQ28514.1 helix-turn-helix transcriptional regulator [Pseudanabaena sp. UWO310]
MAVKLALDDKQEILRLYRESDATTTQLAKQFGISTSTVLRLLQELIPAEEYRLLVSKKKAEGKRGSRVNYEVGGFQVNQLALIPDDLPVETEDDNVNFDQGDETAIAMDEKLDETLNMPEGDLDEDELDDDDESEDDLVDEDNLDLGEDELEDFSEDSEDDDAVLPMFAELRGGHSTGDRLEILPLDRAELPLICYIVVDRIAEIITRPLKDFKDLGAIPPEESLAKTIPIFDNHRVARRFSHHNQRVIKFPSDLIHITRPKLVQKGITRILFSGQVYTLN